MMATSIMLTVAMWMVYSGKDNVNPKTVSVHNAAAPIELVIMIASTMSTFKTTIAKRRCLA